LIVQGVFTSLFQTCIYCALIITPHYFLFLYHLAPLLRKDNSLKKKFKSFREGE
jgi:hypothetical protein